MDAVVVGSGPNGLAAAITLARAGRRVQVIEGRETIGGGARTLELTLPGFRHDMCSAVHPLGIASPFFRSLPLNQLGLEWIFPPYALAHPLDGGAAVVIERSLERSAATMGADAAAYARLMAPFVKRAFPLVDDLLGAFPLLPQHPMPTVPFGLFALMPAALLAKVIFRASEARAVFAGLAAHINLPLELPLTASAGLMLGMLAHAVGWPLARTGSQAIANALGAHMKSLGGSILTGRFIADLDELPPARSVLMEVTPRQMLEITKDRLPAGYRRALQKFRYGPGVCKVDYALDGPVPWTAEACRLAGTVHVGGTFEEILASESQPWRGEHAERPFVLVAQPSLFDATRAPEGRHTLWAYCHTPNGSDRDMSAAIEAQIERFAPGIQSRILAKHVATAKEMQAYDPTYIGGDINGGAQTLAQFFTRPLPRLNPYATPLKGLYFCSSSTPPGGGVHGMCGYQAARRVLKVNT